MGTDLDRVVDRLSRGVPRHEHDRVADSQRHDGCCRGRPGHARRLARAGERASQRADDDGARLGSVTVRREHQGIVEAVLGVVVTIDKVPREVPPQRRVTVGGGLELGVRTRAGVGLGDENALTRLPSTGPHQLPRLDRPRLSEGPVVVDCSLLLGRESRRFSTARGVARGRGRRGTSARRRITGRRVHRAAGGRPRVTDGCPLARIDTRAANCRRRPVRARDGPRICGGRPSAPQRQSHQHSDDLAPHLAHVIALSPDAPARPPSTREPPSSTPGVRSGPSIERATFDYRPSAAKRRVFDARTATGPLARPHNAIAASAGSNASAGWTCTGRWSTG